MRDRLSKVLPQHLQQTKRNQLNRIVQQLKNKGYIDRKRLLDLVATVSKNLQHQPNMITLQSPISVIGDIHGQFYDLLNIFETFGSPQKTKYLFLGDYVDRGAFNIQVMTMLVTVKVLYPNNIFLLRGNHQCRILTTNFNFKEECMKKYDSFVYNAFMELFDLLPICAIIDRMYFAVHAGISPQTSLIRDFQKINRFNEIPEKGVICDLLWSDPVDQQNHVWEANKMRSCSYYYSPIQASRFLTLNNVKLIIRGHQVQMKGYKYQEGKQSKTKKKNLTLTVFSAPNYCDTYKNEGAVLQINKDDVKIRNFKFTQHPIILANYMNVIEWSLPFVASSVGKMFIAILKNRSRKKGTVILEKAQWDQKLSALQRVDIINSVLNCKAQQNQKLLQLKNEQEDNYEEEMKQVTIQSMLQKFLIKKDKDIAEKRPEMFGPKIYQCRKLVINPDEDEPIQ